MFWDRRVGDRRDHKPKSKPDSDRRRIGEGVEESLDAKVLKIMFECQEDKYRFIAAFSRR